MDNKTYAEFRKARENREIEPWIDVTQREVVPPEKSIEQMTDPELMEYWQRMKLEIFRIEKEMNKRHFWDEIE